MTKRSLVTGATGFAGGYLIDHLLAADEAVLAGCAELTTGANHTRLPDVEWVEWDLTNPDGPDSAVADRIEQFGPEIIYHLAALSIPADCGPAEPTPRALAVNVEGTRRVVELAGQLSSRPRVIVISSSHVYGRVDPTLPVVDETALLRPINGYGKTKQAAEQAAHAAAEHTGVELVIVRAFQHTGPGQNTQMMLPQWASQMAANTEKPIEVHTLDAHVDVSDVRDVVRAYRLLAEHGKPSEVYNVGSGVSRRSGDIVELLRHTACCTRPIVELRPGRKQDPTADISRLTACTGWRPEIPIEQTIADTWAWWCDRITGTA